MADNAKAAAAAASDAASTANDAAQAATDAANAAASHAEAAENAATTVAAAKRAVDEHAAAIMQAAQDLSNRDVGSALPAKASLVTNAWQFNAALRWLNGVVRNAQDLDSLRAYLDALEDQTQKLVDQIDEAERQTLGRLSSGVPRVGGQ